MKRTAIAIAVGALSTGLSHGVLAQDEDTQQNLDQQQMSEEDVREQTNGDANDVRIEGEPTDVQVDQEPAEIEVEQKPPEVTVEQQAPDVTIEQPDPDVEVDQAEPDVTVEQEGEAEVEVERAEEAEAEIRDHDDEAEAEDRDERDPADREGLMGMQVSDLEGRDVFTQDGEEIGDVDRVVRHTQDGDIYVIVTDGGFLGIGEDEMAFPLDELQLSEDDEIVLQSPVSDIQRDAGDFDDDDYEELEGDEQLGDIHQRDS